MYQVKIEYLPDGNLNKKKTLGTLHIIPVGETNYRYRIYDENMKVVKQDQLSDVPKATTPWQVIRQILSQG